MFYGSCFFQFNCKLQIVFIYFYQYYKLSFIYRNELQTKVTKRNLYSIDNSPFE